MNTIPHTMETMSYRERVAWLSLIAISITFGPYFIWMAISPPTEPLPDLGTMKIFAITVIAQMFILGSGHLWLRMRSKSEANSLPDERDRAISQRSIGIAYYLLISGMILVGCVMPFNSGGWKLINTAVAVIVLAEGVHYGMIVWSYRRGWHD